MICVVHSVHANQPFKADEGIDVTVLWSVYYVHALCSNGRSYRHDFLCISPMPLPDCIEN